MQNKIESLLHSLRSLWGMINEKSPTCPPGNLMNTLTAAGSEASGSSGISLASSIFCCWIKATLINEQRSLHESWTNKLPIQFCFSDPLLLLTLPLLLSRLHLPSQVLLSNPLFSLLVSSQRLLERPLLLISDLSIPYILLSPAEKAEADNHPFESNSGISQKSFHWNWLTWFWDWKPILYCKIKQKLPVLLPDPLLLLQLSLFLLTVTVPIEMCIFATFHCSQITN